jgi:hypothetical protein
MVVPLYLVCEDGVRGLALREIGGIQIWNIALLFFKILFFLAVHIIFHLDIRIMWVHPDGCLAQFSHVNETSTASGKPGTIPGKPGKVSGKPGKVSGKPGKVSGKPKQVSGKPGKVSGKPEKGVRKARKSVRKARKSVRKARKSVRKPGKLTGKPGKVSGKPGNDKFNWAFLPTEHTSQGSCILLCDFL